MEVNTDKCQMLPFYKLNQGRTYTANVWALGIIIEQRDRGLQAHSPLKVATNIDRVMNKVLDMFAFMNQSTEYKSSGILMQLY